MVVLGWLESEQVGAEIIFHDSFTGGMGNVTNSTPFLDVQGDGWQMPPGANPLDSDGQGHLFAVSAAGGAASVALIPIGPHGLMTAAATMQLPPGTLHWIGFGFANGNETFTNPGSQSGPWVRVNNDGSIVFYGGAGTNDPNPVPDAWLNNGTPVTFSLTYNAFEKTVTVVTVMDGATNFILDSLPVTTSLSAIAARHLVFQFSATAGILSNRWAGPVTVNWIPRPPPLLTLPVPTNSITVRMVGSPTLNNDDTAMIQAALTYAASHSPAEVQFDAGATYVITNSATNAFIPLTLARATNVVVNGNGCKIVIHNPRIGFLHLQSCSNVIVEGITVDYDPLPYTQGVVTRNLYTDPLRRPKSAIKFRLDDGYPAPTNANYMDTNDQAHTERW